MKRRNHKPRLLSNLGLLMLPILLLVLALILPPLEAGALPEAFTVSVAKVGQGTVTVDPDGGAYNPNDIITLTATPDPGWNFAGWTDTAVPSLINVGDEMKPQIQVEVISNDTITATFVRCFQLTKNVFPADPAGGTINVVSDTHPICTPLGKYISGSTLSLTAVPAAGYDFVNWTGAVSGSTTIVNLTMDSDKTVTANFELGCRALVRQVGLGVGIGLNAPPTASTDQPNNCAQGYYKAGEKITMTANPDPGWEVLSWQGTIPAGSAMLTMPALEANKSHTVTVNYVQKPTLNFALATEQNPDLYKVEENVPGGIKTITVVRTGKLDEAVSVDYEIADGTAEHGKDYTGAQSGTLDFEVNVQEQTFDITIKDDKQKESDVPETILLKLLNPSPVDGTVLGVRANETLRILDNEGDPALQFDFENLEVSEADGTIPINVTLFPTSISPVLVKVKINEQSASVGDDYSDSILPDDEISFFPGESTKTIFVKVNEDQLSEGDELFELELYDVVGAVLGQQSTATVTIKDNDPLPDVSFSQAQYFAMVGGSTAELTLLLSAASGQDISVAYVVRNPDGEIQEEGTVVFPAGEITATIAVDIQGAVDKDEYMAELSDPENAVLGSPDATSLFVLVTGPEDCHPLTFSFSGFGLPPAPTNLDRSLGCLEGSYLPGELIGVMAQPAPGWYLSQWQGTNNDNAVGIENVVIMPNKPHEVKAFYLTRVFLAVVNKFDFFPTTNEVEPNNTFVQANGPMKFDEDYHGGFESADDPEDRFFFILNQASDVEITLTDIPNGRDYDLFLYDENWADGQIEDSRNNNNLPEMITMELPAGKYYLRIIPGQSEPSSAKYTLKVVLQ